MGDYSSDQPGYQKAKGDHVSHHSLFAEDLFVSQRQAALKKDYCNGEGYKGGEQIPHKLIRVKQFQDRTSQNPGDEEKDDGRQLHPPGQPLAAATDQKNERKGNESMFNHSGGYPWPGLLKLFENIGKSFQNC